MSERYPLIIKCELFEVPGIDENVFWFLNKLALYMSAKTNKATISYNTLIKVTGWGKEKINKVADKTQSLGLMVVTKTKNQRGDWLVNEYRFTTKLIGFLKFEALEGLSLGINDEGLSEKPTTAQIVFENQDQPLNEEEGLVGKTDKGLSENRTLSNTSSSLANFVLDEERKNIVKMAYGFTDLELELERLNFIDKYKNQEIRSPHNVFTKWLKIEYSDKCNRQARQKALQEKFMNKIKPVTVSTPNQDKEIYWINPQDYSNKDEFEKQKRIFESKDLIVRWAARDMQEAEAKWNDVYEEPKQKVKLSYGSLLKQI